jgi:hypothetical protein
VRLLAHTPTSEEKNAIAATMIDATAGLIAPGQTLSAHGSRDRPSSAIRAAGPKLRLAGGT